MTYWKAQMGEQLSAATAGRFTRWHWIMLVCLLAATLASRLWRLETPDELYFDEVYFGFTAQQQLAGDRDIYNPDAQAPPDRGYEWTHPPLGKLIIAGTMAATSTSMWGMRLSSVLFGTAGVALVVLTAYLLTRSPPAGLLAGLLYAVEGLNFVMSRVATIDIHQTAVILASVAFYVAWRRRPGASNWLLLGAGAMAGAAIATKWIGVFLLTLLGLDILISWVAGSKRFDLRTVLWAFASLAIVPAVIYIASYVHYFLMGHSWNQFVGLQERMWSYHTGLKDTHPAQSKPWQWLLNLRPVWMYVNNPSPDRIANIYNLGNSVVLYFGLAAMALTAAKFILRRRWEAGFLLAAYLIFWLPWVYSPRIMFFYHYLASTAFLCVAAGWVLWSCLGSSHRALRIIAWTVPALAVVWFAVFYPNMTAGEVPRWWAQAVYGLLDSWLL